MCATKKKYKFPRVFQVLLLFYLNLDNVILSVFFFVFFSICQYEHQVLLCVSNPRRKKMENKHNFFIIIQQFWKREWNFGLLDAKTSCTTRLRYAGFLGQPWLYRCLFCRIHFYFPIKDLKGGPNIKTSPICFKSKSSHHQKTVKIGPNLRVTCSTEKSK